MRKYKVTLSWKESFEVDADNKEEAEDVARDKSNNEDTYDEPHYEYDLKVVEVEEINARSKK